MQQKLEENLEEIKNPKEIENEEEKKETADIQQQAEEVIASIGTVESEPKKVEIKIESPTSKVKSKATDITLRTIGVGGVIGATIGTLKRKSGEKIKQLKQKGEEVIENIAQQQKKTRKKKTARTPKKETKGKKEKVETLKVETPKVDTEPIIQTPADNSKNKTKKKNDVKPKVEPKVITPRSKMAKEELMEALKKAERFDTKILHTKGMNLLIINKLICYLKDNNDPEIQERLNREIVKLQTDRHENTDKLFIYNPSYANIQTLKYMYDSYKDGVKSSDGSRDIVSANPNAAAYYLYLANNAAQDINSKGKESDKKEITDKFESNKEETCYRYFEYLKEK